MSDNIQKPAATDVEACVHDLRGALQTIEASTALLTKALAGDVHLLAHIDVIRRCIERMRRRLDDLAAA